MHIRNQLNSIKSNVSADAVYPATSLARRPQLAIITIASLLLRASAARQPS